MALSKRAEEDFAIQYVKSIRAVDPGIGGIKLWYMYRQSFACAGDKVLGRDRFCEILSEKGLKVRQRLRKPKTTDSTHGLPVYPNLVKDFIPTAANQLWVSDITYISIGERSKRNYFCYLSLILDSYTEEIVGWALGLSLDSRYPLMALRMALTRIEGKDELELIHHSDRGCQYACSEYITLLKVNNIRISMTETGDPKDNAQAERINNTMKNELLKDKVFDNLDQVKVAVADAIDFYNNKRPHMSIGMYTPSQAVNMSGERDMKWRSYRHEAIRRKQREATTAGATSGGG